MFIYRFFILYFTYNRHWGVYENYFFNQEISCRPKFHSHGIYIMYSSIHMHWYIYINRTVCFTYCVSTCKFINDLKAEISIFISFYIRIFLFLLNRFYYIAATIIIIAIIICLMMINHVNIFNMSSPVLHKIWKLEWDVNVRPS